EIDEGIANERRRVERAYRALARECGRDRARFARRWREIAGVWRFDADPHRLIEQHNEWYPVERRLPMNPRTGDYVPVGGGSDPRPGLRPHGVLVALPSRAPA